MNRISVSRLFDLSGMVAVVSDSGGLSSIDVGPVLAEAGASVVIVDQDPEKARALAGKINDAGGEAAAYPADIEKADDVIRVFDSIRDRFRRFDILVNCAGITANQPLLETTLEQFDDLYSLNLRSTFILMREGVRIMKQLGRGGRIVNVSTMGTLHPVLNGNAAYAASRTGVVGMTRAIALDHAPDGILANLVLPGAIASKTRFHATTQDAMSGGRKMSGPAVSNPGRLPLGMGDGSDIAAAVLYLVAPSGRYITGQSITLDGGFLLT